MTFWIWSLIVPLVLTILFIVYAKTNLYDVNMFDNWAWILLGILGCVPFSSYVAFLIILGRFVHCASMDGYKGEKLFKDTELNRFLFQSHFE